MGGGRRSVYDIGPPSNTSLFLTTSFYPGCAVAVESPASLGLAAVASISVLLRPTRAELHQLMMGELPPVDCYVSGSDICSENLFNSNVLQFK